MFYFDNRKERPEINNTITKKSVFNLCLILEHLHYYFLYSETESLLYRKCNEIARLLFFSFCYAMFEIYTSLHFTIFTIVQQCIIHIRFKLNYEIHLILLCCSLQY